MIWKIESRNLRSQNWWDNISSGVNSTNVLNISEWTQKSKYSGVILIQQWSMDEEKV